MQGDKAVVIGDRSLSCGHCAAVCPVDAITIHAIDPEASRYATFDADSRWLPHGEFNTVQLVRLMASRRTCRNFKGGKYDGKTEGNTLFLYGYVDHNRLCFH